MPTGASEHLSILEIEPTSGKPTVVQSGGPDWMGAAVTTIAPIR